MATADTIATYIVERQVEILSDAPLELQIEDHEIASLAGIPWPTWRSYAEGRNKLSLCAVKRLLRVRNGAMAPLLSRLFAPEGFELVKRDRNFDPHQTASAAADFIATYVAETRDLDPKARDRLMEIRARFCMVDDQPGLWARLKAWLGGVR